MCAAFPGREIAPERDWRLPMAPPGFGQQAGRATNGPKLQGLSVAWAIRALPLAQSSLHTTMYPASATPDASLPIVPRSSLRPQVYVQTPSGASVGWAVSTHFAGLRGCSTRHRPAMRGRPLSTVGHPCAELTTVRAARRLCGVEPGVVPRGPASDGDGAPLLWHENCVKMQQSGIDPCGNGFFSSDVGFRRGAPTMGSCEPGQGRKPAAISSGPMCGGPLVGNRGSWCA